MYAIYFISLEKIAFFPASLNYLTVFFRSGNFKRTGFAESERAKFGHG